MTAPRPAVNRRPARPARGVCRLMLVINGKPYNLRRIPCDPSAALRADRLRKPDGAVYHVALTGHGATCDCPDFTFHREGLDPGGCKHIKALAAVGLMTTTGTP
jgi:hypothetical protein